MNEVFAQAMSLEIRLASLRDEHREIDFTISQLGLGASFENELTLHRLKKRRTMVDERINMIERLLVPETRA